MRIGAPERFLEALQLPKRNAAVIVRPGVLGTDRHCPVKANQRLLVTAKLVEQQTEVRLSVRGVRISFQHRSYQIERFDNSALLVSNYPEQVQRVELVGLHLENAQIEVFGFCQCALLVDSNRLVEEPGHIGCLVPERG